MKVTAIMACHNRRELTLAALEDLFAEEAAVDIDVVLVDDGSTDGTSDAVRERFDRVHVVHGDGTLYWAASMALAERHALDGDPDVLLWLNDDVDLLPDAVQALASTSARTSPPAVVAGAVSDPVTGEFTYGGLRVSRWHALRTKAAPPDGTANTIDAFNGNVVWVPVEAARKVGPIDGKFAHAYADIDYGLRLRDAGHPVVSTPGYVGRCDRFTSSRRSITPPTGLRARWAALNSPRGLPLRSQFRFFRRHGPPLIWPVFALVPYAREALRRPPSRSAERRGPSDRGQD